MRPSLKRVTLKPATVKKLLTRMLHELKAVCIVSHQFEAAMECCSLLLQWHSDDVHLNRERALSRSSWLYQWPLLICSICR